LGVFVGVDIGTMGVTYLYDAAESERILTKAPNPYKFTGKEHKT